MRHNFQLQQIISRRVEKGNGIARDGARSLFDNPTPSDSIPLLMILRKNMRITQRRGDVPRDPRARPGLTSERQINSSERSLSLPLSLSLSEGPFTASY